MRVGIVEDHALTRMGLRTSLLHAGFTVCAEAADGVAGLRALLEAQPDVAVIDLGLPGKDGVELIADLKRAGLACGIVVLTMMESEEDVHAALAAGADAYCVKTAPPERIVEAVHIVSEHGAYFDPHIAHFVLRKFSRKTSDSSPLTARETDILRLIAEGLGNTEIAERLSIALGTVKTHIRDILAKLAAVDRAQATAIALRRGLI